jgi:hypothetical protein
MTSLKARSARDRVSIREIKFSKEDVLNDKKDMAFRLSSLLKSVTYLAIANEPVTIYAQGVSSCVKIIDIVDSVQENFVQLRSGMSIPMKSILKIETSL